MKKKNIIIILVIAALLVIVGVTAFLNSRDLEGKKQMQREAKIIIKEGEKELETIGLDDLLGLGPEEFRANLDTSDSGPQEHIYTGIQLNKVLESIGEDIGDYLNIIVKAIDGYTVAFNSGEVLEDGNIYIAYMIDGKPLAPKEEGGSGPYQIIVRKDQFSQRWCKYVTEIILRK
jgi:hypothetical protein